MSPSAVNAADTAWMLVATALVLLMTPALAFFYGGLVRSKNALNTMMMSFVSLGFVGVLWAIVGYSLAFSTGGAWVGDLSRVFLRGVGLDAQGTIPHVLFMAYQGTFAIITAALISGAIVERMRFSMYVLFITLWALLVYSPVAHWVWGGGWLAKWGALDFAGGTVVHVNAASAALVAAIVVGKRQEYPSSSLLPHSVPLTLLGAGLLWFGWFGFNAGSTLGAIGNRFAEVAVVTNLGAASGVIGAMVAIYALTRTFDIGMTANGAIAGLVAITAGSGYVEGWAAIVIGFIAGIIVVVSVFAVDRIRLDDPVGALSAHGMAGIWGTLACGIFTSKRLAELNGIGDPGLWYSGSFHQLLVQMLGIAASFGTVFVASYVTFWVIKKTYGMRVSVEEELHGLDIAEHGMWGYPERFMPIPGSSYHPGEIAVHVDRARTKPPVAEGVS